MGSIKEKIKSFLLRSFRVEDLGDEENFHEKGYANSLFAMQLIMFIENEFDISVENEEMDISNFNTLNHVTDFVASKLGSK